MLGFKIYFIFLVFIQVLIKETWNFSLYLILLSASPYSFSIHFHSVHQQVFFYFSFTASIRYHCSSFILWLNRIFPFHSFENTYFDKRCFYIFVVFFFCFRFNSLAQATKIYFRSFSVFFTVLSVFSSLYSTVDTCISTNATQVVTAHRSFTDKRMKENVQKQKYMDSADKLTPAHKRWETKNPKL